MAKDRSKEILREIQRLRDEISARFDELESKVSGTPVGELRPLPGSVVSSDLQESDIPDEQFVPDAQIPAVTSAGKVSVTVRPLHDLSLARVVEDALARTEGVEEASLRELRGDSATIDTTVLEGVSLVASLRRKLPVAFDVIDSSSDSVTIALAQPTGRRESGVAAPSGL